MDGGLGHILLQPALAEELSNQVLESAVAVALKGELEKEKNTPSMPGCSPALLEDVFADQIKDVLGHIFRNAPSRSAGGWTARLTTFF